MELKLIDDKGQPGEALQVSDQLFGREFNQPLVHQIVVGYQANARGATRAQKGRSQIAKSTRKPWRQKGTGRARAGMASSPLWRGGGKIFPNSPDENFSHKINRKMYHAGMCAILSQLAREDRLVVVDDLKVTGPKTSLLARKLKSMGLESVMILTEGTDHDLHLSARNLPQVLVLDAGKADPVSLISFAKVLLTRGAIKKLEELLA